MAGRGPRDIGTHTESAVVRFMRTAGFPHAERRALRGTLDAGDITGVPGVAVSVKGGAMACTASDNLIQTWLDELMTQVVNAGAHVGILVVQRRGIGERNAGKWWAIMPSRYYVGLDTGDWDRDFLERPEFGPLRMHLSQACALLCRAGYGAQRAEVVASG